MKTKRKSQKPKRGPSADAPASEDKGRAARKEAFDLAEASTIHELMELNGPRVAKWALQCVQKAARGRASLFEQKIALLMIQKSTPSTARKGEEEAEPLPDGATKDEFRALNALIEEEKKRFGGLAPAPEGGNARASAPGASYTPRDASQAE